jgi:hypothetical protein
MKYRSIFTLMATAVVLGVTATVSFAQSVTFSGATSFGVTQPNFFVVVNDFNGDGAKDLAVLLANNRVAILLGDGSGGFGAPTSFPVGNFPESIAVGDFNLDGKPDLAVANRLSNDVSILLNTGSGSFGPATNLAVGMVPLVVAVGDFNSDNKEDLAVTVQGPAAVAVLLGNGTGGFGAPTNFPVGTIPTAVAVGDFNSDGRRDLAVATNSSSNVSILLGDGAGNFTGPTTVTAGNVQTWLAVGDFNLDGKHDLAVANVGSNNVSILMGTGTGSFTGPTNFTAGTDPFWVAVEDFNGDGKPDIAVANSGNNNVSILLGNGAGGFASAVNFSVGAEPATVAVGDFNGDQKPDLATDSTTTNITVLLNTSPSTFLVASILPSSRSVQVGNPATAFGTTINAGSNTAIGVGITLNDSIPASLTFQTTDPATNAPTGTPNAPVDIPVGASQSFIIALTPQAPVDAVEVALSFSGANASALKLTGINTLLFSASATPVPDIVALSATTSNDGIVTLASTGFFAVATVNVGATGMITVSADTGSASLPVNIFLCQTDPATGQCISAIGPSVTTQINANATPTFGIFVTGTGVVPFDPAANRIFVRFKDASGVTRGSTSVAVRTQ